MKTKQKTARIIVYQVFGTNRKCADVYYRGKLLKTIHCSEVPNEQAHLTGLLEAARKWVFASGQGFTRTTQALN